MEFLTDPKFYFQSVPSIYLPDSAPLSKTFFFNQSNQFNQNGQVLTLSKMNSGKVLFFAYIEDINDALKYIHTMNFQAFLYRAVMLLAGRCSLSLQYTIQIVLSNHCYVYNRLLFKPMGLESMPVS